MDTKAPALLWGAEVEASLAVVPAAQVRWARLQWALERRPVREIAAALGTDEREVWRILHGGRGGKLAAGVYAAMPWPAEALAVLEALDRGGAVVDTPRGHQVPTAKLTQERVRYIREQYRIHGRSANSLAQELGLHHSTVLEIVRGVSWRHVPASDGACGPSVALVAEPEAPPLPQPITGRLEWLDEGGTVLAVFGTIRDAERASGEDRLAIAAAANAGKGRWRYEVETVFGPHFEAADDDENGGDWYEIPEIPAKPTRSRRY